MTVAALVWGCAIALIAGLLLCDSLSVPAT